MRRFYAPKENFRDDKIILNLEETRHLRDVLRLREDDKVRVFDGAGREFLGQIEKIAKKETVLQLIEETAPQSPESALHLTLAVALLKGEKFDWVIQKAVELGVTKFVPLQTKRADMRLKDSDKRLERWQKIALEACKQSGRARLMEIEKPLDFEEFLKISSSPKSGSDDECLILFAERGGRMSFSMIKTAKKITAVIGSEGGWDSSEIELAAAGGFQTVTLSGRILRAETAAIAVAAILQNRFGDLI